MTMAQRETLIGYGMSFASFLIASPLGADITKIVLFGSVARGDFTEESDIDLFIDVDEKQEKSVESSLSLFRQSRIQEAWKLKGISNEISLKIGRLDQWKLKREVISSGILLYGKYNELPPQTKYYLLIRLESMIKKPAAAQMKIWRALYGYQQKVGKKVYASKGMIEQCGGKKLAKGIFIVPMESRKDIIPYLNKNNVRYAVHEIWSDGF